MKNTPHTPGPWHVTQFAVIRSDRGVFICDPFAESEREPVRIEERAANADLIAAAPDLLGALISMMNRYGDNSANAP